MIVAFYAGFLLELSSVLHGVGANIQEAHIQSCPVDAATCECPDGAPVDIAPPGYDFKKGRYFKFLLSDEKGNKLVRMCEPRTYHTFQELCWECMFTILVFALAHAGRKMQHLYLHPSNNKNK